MKCKYCEIELSDKVCIAHMKICPKRPSEKEMKKIAEKDAKRVKEAQNKEALKQLEKLPSFIEMDEENTELLLENEALKKELKELKAKK